MQRAWSAGVVVQVASMSRLAAIWVWTAMRVFADLWVFSGYNASSPAWAAAVTNEEVLLAGSVGRGGIET